MGLRGLLSGALALVFLQVVVQPDASGRLAGLLGVPAAIARRFIDPTIPAIPDRRPPDRDQPQPERRYPDPFTPRPAGAPTQGGD